MEAERDEGNLVAARRRGVRLVKTDEIELFEDAFDKLLGAVAEKRAKVLGALLDRQSLDLGPLAPSIAISRNRPACVN